MEICGLCLLCLPLTPTIVRVLPGCPALLFSLLHPGSCGSVPASVASLPQPPDCGSKREAESIRKRPFHQSPPNNQGAAAKREAEGIPEFPQLMKLHTWLSGPSHQLLPVQNPRNRRCERSGRSPECRRQAFFSYTIKRRILFFHGKREWGF